MIKNLEKISTRAMTRERWLKARQGSIGGSDAAAIMGLNGYSSPFSVWAEKLGKAPPFEGNEATRQGTDLEDYVAHRFTEATGKKVRRENSLLKNPAYPFAHANVDRLVVGEDAGLECKTTSALSLKRFKNGEYPVNYYVQCMHYMAVTGAAKWYLAVLVLGKEFLWFEIPRDEDEIRVLMESEKKFWDMVLSETPPAVDGKDATSEALSAIYNDPDYGEAVSLEDMISVFSALDALKADKKRISSEIAEKENEIKARLGNSTEGICGLSKVSWKEQPRRTFNADAYLNDHPFADFDTYYKTTYSRVLRITTKKEK